ncbi:ASYNAPTIC 1 [Hibiscus trionum]|uniref:ASYNAPTIC 1 n=1 Tax=Hibiscus trionum TaxID=183268 RepID=A0A9W7LRY2_HIBTR|nr:ASYNAPTIC 1 [Hibiscus trionum]
MVVAQKVKEAEITEQDSLLLTRNLLRIAIFNISYIRGLFPENYFNDKSVPALGVYDALQKKYLKTLLFCICESVDGAMIEEYSFSFSYSNSDSQEVSMNINRTGNKKQGKAFNCNSTSEVTPNQMRSSACKMVRTLVQLMRTLDKMPEERTILMKLLYYDDVTPMDYEPPFFRGCTEEEAHNSWTKNPLRMEVGNVNSKHFVLALKVKSVLDPCGDENDDIQDEEVSLGVDSVQRDESSDSDGEVSESQEEEFIVAPVDKQRQEEENSVVDEDDTQDPMEDEQQLERVKNWINNLHLDTVGLTDVLSNFPDISVVLTEEIMDKLVKEGILSSSGKDSYTINKQKKSEYEFPVKEEMDGQVHIVQKSPKVEDHMYMKALYHALPMTYVSAAKLQKKLDGQVNQNVVRKIINKMTRDGFVEAKGNRRLGKRVIRSNLTEKRLQEVRRALNNDPMVMLVFFCYLCNTASSTVLTNLYLFLLEQDMDTSEPHNKTNHPEMHTPGSNLRDMSTCGALHSIGSDLTRMRGRSDMNQSEPTISKNRDNGHPPISMAQPIASRESFVPGCEHDRVNGNCHEVDHVVCSRPSQDKRGRKASTVKEPILQYVKRQKSQAV